MKRLKRKIAVYLSIILAVLAVLEFCPTTAKEVNAASVRYKMLWCSGVRDVESEVNSFQVEVGSQLNLGDMIFVEKYTASTYDFLRLSSLTGATYKSSDKTVAYVSSKGNLTAKKIGKAVLTVKYKGAETVCNVRVVRTGYLGSGKSEIKKITSLAKKVTSAYGSGINAKNRYALSQAICNWWLKISKSSTMSDYAYGFRKDAEGAATNKLVSPACLKLDRIIDKLYTYAEKYNPIATSPSKIFVISSASGKKNTRTITANLTKKASSIQIFSIKQMQWFDTGDSYVERDRRAVFDIKVEDMTTGHVYWGSAVATYGSKKIIITMDYLKLKSGRRYRLLGVETSKKLKYGWTKGKTFKAK